MIEHELQVAITPRGNQLSIRGSRKTCEQAVRVLDNLDRRISNQLDVTPGDVKGAIRMSRDSAQITRPDKLMQIKTRRKIISPRSPGQAKYIAAIASNELVFGSGPAGTGKSYLAVACAAEALLEGRVERIIFSRPAVEAGENLGFLPGDMKEKVDPYLRPLYDALYDVMPEAKVERDIADGTIEIAPLAFMRGRTLASSFIILDEAQNTTQQQMKMFLTRLGEGSRMVINGDPSQVDLPTNVVSGLSHATSLLEDIDGIAHVVLTADDIVRHPLVSKIVGAYDKDHKRPDEGR
ncbi:MAG TPA: PhoH family protein [Rhizobiales bacterium]|nr:PhoH family protein [Hyphomicrobiales bacterium]